MQPHGLIASFGNAGGIELKTTVLPFILRGVRLIGVDSAVTPMPLRRKVWGRLATDLKPRHLDSIAKIHHWAGRPGAGYFERMLKGKGDPGQGRRQSAPAQAWERGRERAT
jgi:acrylyl-CoA reductase (NADPH)